MCLHPVIKFLFFGTLLVCSGVYLLFIAFCTFHSQTNNRFNNLENPKVEHNCETIHNEYCDCGCLHQADCDCRQKSETPDVIPGPGSEPKTEEPS